MTSLVEVESLSKKYGKEVILEDINFTINQGDKIALIGKNGSGKTTLLNIITKLQKRHLEKLSTI
ncbi:ATP-binding cassette domain-containing protein [Dolosigranulum pigrum]|uniref:ATP-binding cassette domain-containing protein n=1 Tax=Dolosigranulum pigrum TaxID=29394 RepID=UPI001AD87FFB|nr:ATP-binding cassette domain-containing protein [Dolosigranulum pigrum]QTJ48299.1 ATP-binding cassette domain-containing protein [Dolosigranulum pigrum]